MSIFTYGPILLNSPFVPTTVSKLRFSPLPLPPQRSSSVLCFSSLSDMDNNDGQSIYPLHRCKTLHLLTPLGWKQVDNLRAHVQACGLSKKIELVIASPLLRTMQTAVGVFGGEAYTDGINAPPLMKENVGHSERAAISSLNSPPFIAVELCREHLGVHPCDKRRNINEYRDMFPAIDFSLIESDEDIL